MEDNTKYKPTIGLEIHAELKTKTKMFCACKNPSGPARADDTDETRPNVNICPVCMGHPGTLPVINKQAVKSVLKVGLALGGKLADETEFDRKNYFYPDIPKGYQISQYKYPLVSGGELNGVQITRVHLEEDTAKSSHTENDSLVDFNRAGVPLMELVTEPVLHSGEEVMKFGRELQLLLQYLGVSEANMEKGEMRLEVNISVQRGDLRDDFQGLPLGTKVEVKNINSFRGAERAVAYEIKRQSGLLENGEKVNQETRGWDEAKQTTFSQRSKEDSHDYRYFPDPDLPKLKLSEVAEFGEPVLLKEMQETPSQKRIRFKNEYHLKDEDIEFYVLNINFGLLFEATTHSLKDKKDYQLLSNYIVSDIAGFSNQGFSLNPEYLAKLLNMFSAGLVSSRGVKDLLLKMTIDNSDPEDIAKEADLLQKSDKEELTKIANDIISQNTAIVLEYKSGKVSGLQFLIGQAMKATKGAGNPQMFKTIFEDILVQ